MKSNLISWFFMLAAICVANNLYGQENPTTKEIIAYPLGEVKLDLDGKVDEEFWLAIPPSGDFRMTVPIEGGEPTQKTEIRIAFDDENLYISAILYDTDPSGIKAFQMKRDAGLRTDDRFMWISILSIVNAGDIFSKLTQGP